MYEHVLRKEYVAYTSGVDSGAGIECFSVRSIFRGKFSK